VSTRAYPEYKDSGDSALGLIPAYWYSSKIKWYIDVFNGFDAKTESGEIPVYGANGVLGHARSATFIGNRVLIGRVGSAGTVNLATSQFCVSDNALVIEIQRSIDCRFLYYWAVSQDFSPDITTTSQPLLTGASVKNYSIGFPEPQEQEKIADFIDHETARIDALVAEQKRLIDLLKEKRQAVISHAVTKGLDPNVPMKDSGVEWLGEVPAHWQICRLKNVSPFITVGIVVNPSNYIADEGLPFIYGGDVSNRGISHGSARNISLEDSEKNLKTQLREGDLLTVRVGDPGVTAVVPKECDGGNCASVMLIRKGHYSSEWLCYLMNSRFVGHQVRLVQYGAAQKQFNIADAIEFVIPKPPSAEQKAIVGNISRQLRGLDELEAQALRSIYLLSERRSALISAAVTGKIDVRDWQPAEKVAENATPLPMAAEERASYRTSQ